MRRLALAAMVAVGFGGWATPALAWGEQGHAAVCELAYRNLTPTSRAGLVDLFKAWSARNGMAWRGTRNEDLLYHRFMNSCIFEDVVKRRGELARFKDQAGHFVNYPRTRLTVADGDSLCPPKPNGSAVKCIFNVLGRDLAVFRNPINDPGERAEALIGIGHWLGDIHQPLHVSFADDLGGNTINVTGPCGTTNLHSVWDKCLVMKGLWNPIRLAMPSSRRPRLDANPRTIAYRLVDKWRRSESQPQVKAEVMGWMAQTQPWQWAQESYTETLATGIGPGPRWTITEYCFKRADRCDYDEQAPVYVDGAAPRQLTLPADYVTRYAPVAETRLRQAGYRLAWIINSTLDQGWNHQLPTCSVSLGTCPDT